MVPEGVTSLLYLDFIIIITSFLIAVWIPYFIDQRVTYNALYLLLTYDFIIYADYIYAKAQHYCSGTVKRELLKLEPHMKLF